MKTQRYKFETAVQAATQDTTQWLKEEFKSILESDKDFTRKADYIGLSINSIDTKVTSLDEEIKELQQLKKNLKSAKEIALTTGAEVFSEYGIDKLEGAGISSITLTKATSKQQVSLDLIDPDELINLGYSKVIVDEEAVQEALLSTDESNLLRQYATLTTTQTLQASKLKVNKRRANNSIKPKLEQEVA